MMNASYFMIFHHLRNIDVLLLILYSDLRNSSFMERIALPQPAPQVAPGNLC